MGTSQTLLVGNGLTRKPISNCILCIVTAIERCLGYVVAFVLPCRSEMTVAAGFVGLSCRGRNSDPTGAKSTRRDA
ncbi:hypothetical protein PMIN01_11887 [Paraphaeosphaeria minitans]|uniref:Uncharacterized protein n=1 Tax=Paraphaeosphaeria minitans TaxID=565426 RepID=A0A9P6KKZ8_9PLEO|nr:hypothetical protein PMIN01_11887 [Paraphaeosphaeria minitans]